jgi:NAD(P)-dependent dehydrogenase (short-subunit alcohol dehydrogenase family)
MPTTLQKWILGPTKGSDNSKRLDGKIAVITGANTGIGKEIAKDLSSRGAKIIMLCRNVDKAKEASKEIESDGAIIEIHKVSTRWSIDFGRKRSFQRNRV